MIRLSAEIYVGENIYEISDNLISIDFSGQDRSDPSLPSWGIKLNSGSLEMFDTDGTIEKLSREGSLEGSKIEIYLNVGKRKKQVGGFYIIGADKDRTTEKTKIQFEDLLMSWQQISVPKYYNFYDTSKENITIANIIDFISEKSGIFNVLGNTDKGTKSRTESICITHPQLEEGTVWSQMTKICEASSCYIYCDNEGNPRIYYGGDT